MSYQIDLSGRVAFITGASSGLGEHFARTLSQSGAAVVLAARRVERLKTLRAELESTGGDAHVVPLDVTDHDSIKSAVAHAETEMGTIDILVNNSGVSTTQRLVDVSPKIGTRVLPFADWNLLDRDVLTWRLNAQFDRKIVEDIFEMRLCFEPRASFLAARDGSVEDHEQIVRHCKDLAAAYAANSEPKDVSEAALEFHLAVINASQNGMFLTIGSAIKSALRASSEMLQKQAARPSEDVELHESVANAIVSRKPREASRAMEELLMASRDRLLPLTIRAAVIEPAATAAAPAPAVRAAARKTRLRSAP